MMKKSYRNVLLAAALFGSLLTAGPSFAQMDLAGQWAPIMDEDQNERGPGPALGEYMGLPINDASRARAELWDAAIQTLPEWQCRPHGADYITRGPSQPFVTPEYDPVSRNLVAYHFEWLRSVDRPVYMDGRPHPSENAAHTWAGFSTGRWIGNVLEIRTTHLKEDYVRRNGLPRSDKAHLTEYLIRNDDILTWVTITHDPVYLSEPLIRTTEFGWRPNQQVPPYPCTIVEEVDRPAGVVPHHFPGENRDLNVAAKQYGLPLEATLGGPATMYPEFRKRLKDITGRRQ